MPYTLERLPGMPVLLNQLEGKITIEELRALFAESAELFADTDGPVYRISVIGEGANISFGDVIAVVRESMKKTPGSSGDPRFHAVWVGKHHMAKLFADMLRSTPLINIEMPFFDTYEKALEYVQLQFDMTTMPQPE